MDLRKLRIPVRGKRNPPAQNRVQAGQACLYGKSKRSPPVCLWQFSGSVAGLRTYVYRELKGYCAVMAAYEKYAFSDRRCGDAHHGVFSVSVPEYYFPPAETDIQYLGKDRRWKLCQPDSDSGKG